MFPFLKEDKVKERSVCNQDRGGFAPVFFSGQIDVCWRILKSYLIPAFYSILCWLYRVSGARKEHLKLTRKNCTGGYRYSLNQNWRNLFCTEVQTRKSMT